MAGAVPDVARQARVDELVQRHGPVRGLELLEEAEAACWRLQGEYAAKGWFGAARGCEAAAYSLRGDQFDVVGRYA
jgi:hypothetical protein